eukprot:scaffold92112_cov40-Tisochrysis_lutea.AAC.1
MKPLPVGPERRASERGPSSPALPLPPASALARPLAPSARIPAFLFHMAGALTLAALVLHPPAWTAPAAITTRSIRMRTLPCHCGPRESARNRPSADGQPDLSTAAAAAASAVADTFFKAMVARAEADVQRSLDFLSPVAAAITKRDYGPSPGIFGRAKDLLMAGLLAVVTIEICQFCAVATLSWLVSFRTPQAAIEGAILSRGPTRLGRLIIEAYSARHFQRLLRGYRVENRARFVLQRVIVSSAAAAGTIGLIVVAAASPLSQRGCAPAVFTCRAMYTNTFGAFPNSWNMDFGSAESVEAAAQACCDAIAHLGVWSMGILAELNNIAHRTKPLRILLELIEMDQWFIDQGKDAGGRLLAVFQPTLRPCSELFRAALIRVIMVSGRILLSARRLLENARSLIAC